MSDAKGRTQQAKGHLKQAVADVTDNDDLREEGERDRVAGAAKQKVERAKDKVEEKIDQVKDTLDRRDHT